MDGDGSEGKVGGQVGTDRDGWDDAGTNRGIVIAWVDVDRAARGRVGTDWVMIGRAGRGQVRTGWLLIARVDIDRAARGQVGTDWVLVDWILTGKAGRRRDRIWLG